jgi:hypothetical protein
VTGGQGVVIGVGALAVAIATLAYLALPLARTDAAGMACQLTVPGNGTYSVEWTIVPYAHWECVSTPEGEEASTYDLGWWPS